MRQQIVEKLKQEKIEARIEEITASSDVVVPEDFDTTPKVGQPQTSSAAPANRAGTAQDSWVQIKQKRAVR